MIDIGPWWGAPSSVARLHAMNSWLQLGGEEWGYCEQVKHGTVSVRRPCWGDRACFVPVPQLSVSTTPKLDHPLVPFLHRVLYCPVFVVPWFEAQVPIASQPQTCFTWGCNIGDNHSESLLCFTVVSCFRVFLQRDNCIQRWNGTLVWPTLVSHAVCASGNVMQPNMGLHRTAEHESGYFEGEGEDYEEGRASAPQEKEQREYSYSYPVCLEDDCWCLDGRLGHEGGKNSFHRKYRVYICLKVIKGHISLSYLFWYYSIMFLVVKFFGLNSSNTNLHLTFLFHLDLRQQNNQTFAE